LLISSAALGEGIGQLLFRAGVPRSIPLLGLSLEWTGFLVAAVFMLAFRVFSTPVDSGGAA